MGNLLQRIAVERDPQAFQDLFRTYGPKLKAMLMRQGADGDTAEDIAQETLLTVWRKAHLYVDGKGSESTWIYTIARNLRIDRLRRQAVWQDLPNELEEMPSDDDTPDVSLSRSQSGKLVRDAVQVLPEEQYEVIYLSYIEGLSHNEIAEKLGVPLGTVKSRMRLAYQKVRETIGDGA